MTYSMAAAIGIRTDDSSGELRELPMRSKDTDQNRRLLALAVIPFGPPGAAALTSRISSQVIRPLAPVITTGDMDLGADSVTSWPGR